MDENEDLLELTEVFRQENPDAWDRFQFARLTRSHVAHVALESQYEAAIARYLEAIEDGNDEIARQSAIGAYRTAMLWIGVPYPQANAWANLVAPSRRRRFRR
jgi:hypothetical protein